VVVLTGPTGAGKTALGIELALRFDGEIVNADSVQVYRGMDIGSAKPTAEERSRVPHHLLDIVDPDEPYDAGRYMKDARPVIDAIHRRGNTPFLVGGTGLYIRAALEGLIETRGRAPEYRARLEKEHEQALAEGEGDRLYRRLAQIDPETAKTIHPHDLRRIIRALEINAYSSAPASRLRSEHQFHDRPYRVLHLALDPGPEALAERIHLRCERMLTSGLLQELRHLRRAGFGPELRSMAAIGYREMEPVLQGKATLAEAIREIERATRQFARRQRTWLRKLPDVIWVKPEEVDAIASKVAQFLGREAAI